MPPQPSSAIPGAALSLGQSTRTWTTVSFAPHSHLSSSRCRCSFPCVANQEWPVRSCVSKYARFRGSDPYIRLVWIEGSPVSIWRRCPPLSEAFHSCSHCLSIRSLMSLFPHERGDERGASPLSQPCLWLAGLLHHSQDCCNVRGPIGDEGGGVLA